MPSRPRPKTFYAVRDFQSGGEKFKTGDVVTGIALGRVLAFGDRFVTSHKPAKPDQEKE